MIPGKESKTAIMVCMGRALGHLNPPTPKFADPTAQILLSEGGKKRLQDFLAHPKDGRMQYLHRMRSLMVARTVAIDEALQDCAAPQVVILGAGLDGRAWRMDALKDAVVFEVDHPDTQRAKKERAARLTPRAKEIRFVPVDFARDDLSARLQEAGHDPTQRTMWVWEGVVMYLTEAQIRGTLTLVHKRSASGSRLVINYHSPRLFLWVFGLFLRFIGEPLRSAQQPEHMAAILRDCQFKVLTDENVMAIGERLGMEADKRNLQDTRHLRVVLAEKA